MTTQTQNQNPSLRNMMNGNVSPETIKRYSKPRQAIDQMIDNKLREQRPVTVTLQLTRRQMRLVNALISVALSTSEPFEHDQEAFVMRKMGANISEMEQAVKDLAALQIKMFSAIEGA